MFFVKCSENKGRGTPSYNHGQNESQQSSVKNCKIKGQKGPSCQESV